MSLDESSRRAQEGFGPAQAESAAQRILREEYSELTTWNQAIVNSFDPDLETNSADIQLVTTFPEAEDREPELTTLLGISMLRKIGLSSALEREFGPRVISERDHDDVIEQLKFFTRSDGVKIPIFSTIIADPFGGYIPSQITLLSHDEIERIKSEFTKTEYTDELDSQLESIGLPSSTLTTSEKAGMLLAYHSIQALETTNGGIEVSSGWNELSSEKQAAAKQIVAALAEKFRTQTDEFSIVTTENDNGQLQSTVVYSGNGIDLANNPQQLIRHERSWQSIFEDTQEDRFMIVINGKPIDSRVAMTAQVYFAMIEDSKLRGAILPDSGFMKSKHDDVRTSTWLTGENTVEGQAMLAGILDDNQTPATVLAPTSLKFSDLRFRPAVTIS